MRPKPVKFKGLTVVLQRETVAPLRPMSSPISEPHPVPEGATAARPETPLSGTPAVPPAAPAGQPPREIGGRNGPEPTRFGDWEKGGRCIDF